MKRFDACRLPLLAAVMLLPASGQASDIVSPKPDARPVALVAGLAPGALKTQLTACVNDQVRRT
ncbi:MAG: hypothetical protein OEW50_06075, partial [Gammaproteobacteria bacterium]|nr:hypothetical protein [Gammaproteobacteria bacterium]